MARGRKRVPSSPAERSSLRRVNQLVAASVDATSVAQIDAYLAEIAAMGLTGFCAGSVSYLKKRRVDLVRNARRVASPAPAAAPPVGRRPSAGPAAARRVLRGAFRLRMALYDLHMSKRSHGTLAMGAGRVKSRCLRGWVTHSTLPLRQRTCIAKDEATSSSVGECVWTP